jgi:hypothetical protein
MMEKDKLHAKKQALQKKEKDGRLAELKAFHQSFKLNVPIPADLVPLLSKSKKPVESDHSGSPDSQISSPADDKKKKTSIPATTTAKPAASASPVPTVAAATAATATSATTKTSTPPVPVASPAATSATTTNTTATSAAPAAAAANDTSFKFNVKASSFKPNPTAAAFVPGGAASHAADKPSGRPKKGDPSEHLTMTEAFVPSFVDKDIPPGAVGPTWPFGNKSYRVQFSQYAPYEEDVYTGYPSPQYGYGYPQYRYPQYVQGMPPMAVQQGPYMNPQVRKDCMYTGNSLN